MLYSFWLTGDSTYFIPGVPGAVPGGVPGGVFFPGNVPEIVTLPGKTDGDHICERCTL